MDEYIERKAAHDAVVDAIWHGKRSMYSVANSINSVPSADVVPVRHGRWIMHDDEFGLTCECSVCHIETMGDGNYCPNCGAKMDGELNE